MISEQEARNQVINSGIEAMTQSIIKLIEPCIRQRCKQFVEIIENEWKKR